VGLIDEIQNGATLSAVPLAQTLRLCRVLARTLDYEPLRGWSLNELYGYPAEAQIPEYRTIHGRLAGTAVIGYNWATLHSSRGSSDARRVIKIFECGPTKLCY
jgi:hypothetical protein